MEFIIGKNWRVSTDPHCVVLEELDAGGEVIEKGKYKGRVKGDSWKATYHPTFKHALKFLVEKSVRELDDLRSVVSHIDSLQDCIESLPCDKMTRGLPQVVGQPVVKELKNVKELKKRLKRTRTKKGKKQ